MLLDGDIPGWMRPWIGWAVGMDWPQGDESKLFELADVLAAAAYRVADAVGVPVPDRDTWDGEALQTFVRNAAPRVSDSEADLLNRLAGMAVALNDLGVQVQYTKRLIKLSIGFLIFQLWTLVPVILNPATASAGLAAVGLRARFTRAIIRQLAMRLLFNIGLFGGLMLAMDLGVQVGQSRRDKIDWGQALTSLGTGALNGVFLTGATWLAPPRTLLGFMLASGAAGGMTDATMQAFDGQPFDMERLLKGFSSGAIGAADAHWASWNPHFGRAGGDGLPPQREARTPAEAPILAEAPTLRRRTRDSRPTREALITSPPTQAGGTRPTWPGCVTGPSTRWRATGSASSRMPPMPRAQSPAAGSRASSTGARSGRRATRRGPSTSSVSWPPKG